MFDFRHATGQLVAVDAATGRIVWSQSLPTPAFVGATVAGDVVFTGGLDGVLRAFELFTGTVVGSFQTTSGLNAPLAVDGAMVFVPAAGPRFVLDNADPDEDRPAIINQLIAYRLPDRASTPSASE
jgi:outer membrane protein assembly factor BamB